MLAHVGRDDGAPFGQAVQLADDRLRLDVFAGAVEAERLLALPRAYALPPQLAARDARTRFGACARADFFTQGGERLARVRRDGERGRDVLADVGRVNVYVDDARVRREGGELACHSVVEAHADGDEQVALGDRHVRGVSAVHAEHSQAERVRRGEAAQAHERRRDGQSQAFGEREQFIRRAGVDDAAADVEHGALGAHTSVCRAADRTRVWLCLLLSTGEGDVTQARVRRARR